MFVFHKNNSPSSSGTPLLLSIIWLVFFTALLLVFSSCAKKTITTFQSKTTTTQSPIDSITITSPQNGDIWHIGEIVTITWTSTPDIPTGAMVDVFLENGVPMQGQQIGTTTNTGSFNWVVTNIATGNQMAIDIEITTYEIGTLSSGYFTISGD
jgi:hypothetical protein